MSEDILRKLRVELSELSEKYYKLDKFLNKEDFQLLDEYIKDQMINQHMAMVNYKWSLAHRIEYMEDQLSICGLNKGE